MFGMGLTMKAGDFAVVFTRPKDVLVGCIAQFLVMPALAFGLGRLFGVGEELMVGIILVGTCPGGTASNVITYLSGGDTALSVGMTRVNTLRAASASVMPSACSSRSCRWSLSRSESDF